MNRILRGIFCLALCYGLFAAAVPAGAQAAGRIDTVSASVEGGGLPVLVQQRMEKSVQVIAEQVLTGKPEDGNHEADAELIREVFDKVLVGYTVQSVSVDIDGGAAACVRVTLLPWSDTIRQVRVDTTIDGMPPVVEEMVRKDLQKVDDVFEDALLGLPIAATDWTNGVLKQHLREYLHSHLPEFRGDFDLVPEADGVMRVKLTVYPTLPVVRTTDLSMRSDTVPNFTLLGRRTLLQEHADQMVGVPVAFIARHHADFEAYLAQTMDSLPEFRQAAMRTKVTIDPGERLYIMSRSDTTQFRLRLTGWLDMGRSHQSNRDLLFRLHAGTMLSGQDELFLQLDFLPQDVDWDWQTGYAHRLSSKGTGELRYDLRREAMLFSLKQYFLPKWWLRWEYRRADQLSETAVGYRLHDFLSVEAITDPHDSWLRLIGYF